MKAIKYSIILCLAVLFGLVACSNDTDIPPTGAPDGAEKASLGTYTGEWEKTNTRTGQVDTYPGSIVVEPYLIDAEDESSAERNVNILNVGTEPGIKALELKAETSGCNIVFNSSRTMNFWNYTKANPFGVTFTGSISPEGKLSLSYSVDIREGRGNNKTTFTFSFKGNKTN